MEKDWKKYNFMKVHETLSHHCWQLSSDIKDKWRRYNHFSYLDASFLFLTVTFLHSTCDKEFFTMKKCDKLIQEIV